MSLLFIYLITDISLALYKGERGIPGPQGYRGSTVSSSLCSYHSNVLPISRGADNFQN